jgi:hypothetical protein
MHATRKQRVGGGGIVVAVVMSAICTPADAHAASGDNASKPKPPATPTPPPTKPQCAPEDSYFAAKPKLPSEIAQLREYLAAPAKVGATFSQAIHAQQSEETQAPKSKAPPGPPWWGWQRYCGVARPKSPHPATWKRVGADKAAPEITPHCDDAAIRMSPSGRISYNDRGFAGSVCLKGEEWGNSVIARIASTLDSDEEAYCGFVKPDTVYRYPASSLTEPLVSLRVWAGWAAGETLSMRTAARDAAATLLERYIARYFFQTWAWNVSLHASDKTSLAALLEQTAKDVIEEVAPEESHDREKRAVLDAMKQVARKLPAQMSKDKLCQYASNFAAPDDGNDAPARPAVLITGLELKDGVKLKPDKSDFRPVAIALGLANQPTTDSALPWPVFDGVIPGTADGFQTTIALQAGEGRSVAKKLGLKASDRVMTFGYNMIREHAGADGTIVKRDSLAFIPGEKLTPESSDLGVVLASLVRVAIDAAGLGGMKIAATDLTWVTFKSVTEADLSPLPTGWKAPYTSTAAATDVLEPSHRYSVVICRAEDSCDKETKAASIVATVQFDSEPKHALVSTVTELAGSWNWPTGDAPIGGWKLNPVVGTQDPTLFRLNEGRSAGDHVTLSQLIVVYFLARCRFPPEVQGFGVGFGPSLVQGTDAALFKQWNARLLWEPHFARGITLNVGVSRRVVHVPYGVSVDGILVGMADRKPPTIATDEQPMWLFSAGIGVDLSIFGDLWKKLGSSGESGGAAQ